MGGTVSTSQLSVGSHQIIASVYDTAGNWAGYGIDIVVQGSVGHMSAFMAQAGNLIVFGEAGDALGDSIYEARLFVRGKVRSLGADCIEKPMRDEHKRAVHTVLERAVINGQIDPGEFRRYGSARQLYTFKVDNAAAY